MLTKAIWAALLHSISTDNNTQHGNCPRGQDSWCFFNMAVALLGPIPKHSISSISTWLHPKIGEIITPLYERMADENLLIRMSSGGEHRIQMLSKWHYPTVQTIMRFLVFLHTVHKTVIFCWLPSHMGISGNKCDDSAAKAALQKDVSACLISYTDAYQYISQYVSDLWQSERDTAVNNKLHATKPLIGEQLSAYRSVRRDEVVLSRLKLGHSYLTHSYLLKGGVIYW